MFSLNVIIRTKNSGNVLVRCLESIRQQSVKPNSIIVVDTESSDATLKYADHYKCRVLKYPLHKYPFNYSKALNLGIDHANSDFVLIISSHVWLPNKNTIKWMLDKLNEDTNLKAVSLARSNQLDKIDKDIKIPFGTRLNKSNFKGEGMYNYCSLIRKSDWEDYKFREDIPTCEDQDWIWHWMNTANASSFIFQFPLAGYDNPNYNIAKDIQEIYTCGTFIYPPYMSLANIFGLYKKALGFLLKKKLKKAKYHLRLGSALLKYKYFPPKDLQSDSYLVKK